MAQVEDQVLSHDPAILREELSQLSGLIDHALRIEQRGLHSRLNKLRCVLNKEGIFDDPKTKLLIFTEHKETLDFLAADGEDGRPVGKLFDWGLTVARVHRGMAIGDRDTPGTRLCAEREFREISQVLVATDSACEGLNLQFCWLMINFDIPCDLARLEHRVRRIQCYGQEHDCAIFSLVAQNTREGRLIGKLLERLNEIRYELHTDQIFDSVGEIFPAHQFEKMLHGMYARQTDEHEIQDRILRQVTLSSFRSIVASDLEGLVKRELNLSAVKSKVVGANEHGLMQEVAEKLFVEAAPDSGIQLDEIAGGAIAIGSEVFLAILTLLARNKQIGTAGSVGVTPRLFFPRSIWQTNRHENWSPWAIRCLRPCARMYLPEPRTICCGAASSLIYIAISRRCSTSSPHPSRTEMALH